MNKCFAVTLGTFISPITPDQLGGTRIKIPLFKGRHCGLGVSPSEASGVDLGGSKIFDTDKRTFQTSSKSSGDFRSRFISENIVTLTAYKARERPEHPGFWSNHLYSVLQSFHHSSNVERILGTGLVNGNYKKTFGYVLR